MKRIWILLLFFGIGLLSVACENRSSTRRSIEKMEKSVEQSTNPDQVNELLTAYRKYIQSYPEDTLYNARYSYRAAGLAYRMGQTALALDLTRTALMWEPSGDNSSNAIQLLEAIYREKLQDVFLADLIDQLFMARAGQGNYRNENIEGILKELDSLRLQIFDEVTFSVNYGVADRYIQATELFSLIAKDHPESPQVLLRAAEVARAIQAYERALELLARINEQYPKSESNAQAMFLRAFTLDEALQRYDEARHWYQQFIDTYPDDPFADDARFSLENLGKDVNELIEGFEEKNKGESR